MHFSKAYARILLTLPPDLREHAISYRQLKKLINQVVQELTALGFTPTTLHELLRQSSNALEHPSRESVPVGVRIISPSIDGSSFKMTYEVEGDTDHLKSYLRLYLTEETVYGYPELFSTLSSAYHSQDILSDSSRVDEYELVIPLPSDAAFFDLLANHIGSLSGRLDIVRSDFMLALDSLSKSISRHARPVSSSPSSSFKPCSRSTHPSAIGVPSTRSIFRSDQTPDLYLWREILRLYLQAEIFEIIDYRGHRGRSIEDAERRLVRFLDTVHQSDIYNEKISRTNDSRGDIETFIRLNTFILNLKKFNQVNTEATRKILKKHSKRTALPLPPYLSRGTTCTGDTPDAQENNSFVLKLFSDDIISMPRLLVQAIGEVLLPVIPHVDDYSCPICTGIAFTPIRLICGHLFCVRCLVKMQKRGNGNCPLCRAPTVLTANKVNVDWALLNFMKDWFPIESREKLASNEKEAAKEQAEELGMNDGCVIT